MEKDPSISVQMPCMVNPFFVCHCTVRSEFVSARAQAQYPHLLLLCLAATCSREAALSCSWHSPPVTAVDGAAHSTWSQTEWVQGKWQSLMLLCLYQSFTAGWDASSVGPINREVAFLHNFPGDWTHPISWRNKGSDSPRNLPNSFQDSPSHQGLISGIYLQEKLIFQNLFVSNPNENLKYVKSLTLHNSHQSQSAFSLQLYNSSAAQNKILFPITLLCSVGLHELFDHSLFYFTVQRAWTKQGNWALNLKNLLLIF